MTSEQDEPSWDRPKGLDERVVSTLRGLQGRIAFSGLRRVLHAHPESLSRSLRRLEREGRIERSSEGYRVVGRASDGSSEGPPEIRPIAHVDLPPGTVADAVLGRLSGRWFGSLRWVGVVEGPRGRLFAWARRDGTGYVLLGIHRGALRVYVRSEKWADDEAETEDCAYELLTHAVEALRPSSHGATEGMTFFGAAPPASGPRVDN